MARRYGCGGANIRRRATRADEIFDGVVGGVVLWCLMLIIFLVCIMA